MTAVNLLIRSRINILFAIILILTISIPISAKSKSKNVRHLLKRLNKPPVKIIKSPDGDIIDCVNIAHQPVFDHALLKNHTIQMRPSSHPEGILSGVSALKTSEPIISQLWHLNGRCSEGTIPIRRTKRNDILRASSVERFGKNSNISHQFRSTQPEQMILQDPANEHAFVYTDTEGEKYFGAKARINVWGPKVEDPNESSLAQIWILGTRGNLGQDLNAIEAGWRVDPHLYGDTKTRLYAYWTSFGYKDGCYDLRCAGFVQTSNKIALGATISPVSSYAGSQYDITLRVFKDPKDGKWWLQYADETVGYWPGSLFTYLADSANTIQWGGKIVNLQAAGQHTATEMGSGHFPEERFGKAAYFRDIQVVDGSNRFVDPKTLGKYTSQPNCYNIQQGNLNPDWNTYFYYGGSGRNANCK